MKDQENKCIREMFYWWILNVMQDIYYCPVFSCALTVLAETVVRLRLRLPPPAS
jgi:hypothetical protein